MASIRSRKRSLCIWAIILLIAFFVPVICLRFPNGPSGIGDWVSFIGLFFLIITWAVPTPSRPLFMLVLMLGFAGLMLCARNFGNKRVSGALGRFSLVCLVICIGCFVGYTWANHDLRVTSEEGRRLVQAIERYKKDTNQYPEQLELLTPRYIEDVPRTATMGRAHFSYRRSEDGGHFSLGFYPPICIDPMFSWGWDKESEHFWSQD